MFTSIRVFTLVLFSLFGLMAYAVDPYNCPDKFTLEISKISTFKSSVYSDLKGWTAARDLLEANKEDRSISFSYLSQTAKTCAYSSDTEASARLMTITVNDPEENVDPQVDKLKVEFSLDSSNYSFFLEVESYSQKSLKLYSQGPKARNAIRAEVLGESGKVIDVEIGRARIEVK